MKYLHIKRIIDLICSLLLLMILTPIFLLLIVFLFFVNKNSGVFFIQKRPGKNEKIFNLIKFKTMTNEKDDNGNLLSDEKRITKIGLLIRRSSLDEIPQFINVLIGDMSFIGPRPLLVDYLPLYNDHQKRRHEIRPGITGWAQVNGRNAVSWNKKFDLDVWYIDHISFSLDIKILIKTIIKVFKKEGISSESSITAERFTGKS